MDSEEPPAPVVGLSVTEGALIVYASDAALKGLAWSGTVPVWPARTVVSGTPKEQALSAPAPVVAHVAAVATVAPSNSTTGPVPPAPPVLLTGQPVPVTVTVEPKWDADWLR